MNNEEQIINAIKTNIESLKAFDRNRIYPTGPQVVSWNDFSSGAIKYFVDDLFDTLLSLTNKEHMEIYGYNVLIHLRDNLINVVSSYNSYLQVATTSITTEHHQVLNQMQSLSAVLRSSGIYIDTKFDLKNESKELKEAVGFATILNQNKPAYESSIQVFGEALKDKEKFTSAIINEKGELYNNAAKENCFLYVKKYHLTKNKSENKVKNYFLTFIHVKGSFWQLVLSLLFAGIAAYIVVDFIKLAEKESIKNLSVGFVMLRLSSLIIPSYFSVFFSQQYLKGDKLYQFYRFKGIALTTLSQLYTLYPNHQDQIMEKALNVIFSEFNESNNNISQKELFSFVTDVVKSKVGS